MNELDTVMQGLVDCGKARPDAFTRNRVINRLKLEEGFRDYAYDDANGMKVSAPQGELTFGYGFTFPLGEATSERLLAIKLREHEADLSRRMQTDRSTFLDELPIGAWAVLVDMAYNLGVPRLMGFEKMLAAIERMDWKAAAAEVLDSRYARQVPNRAERNALLLRSLA